MTSRFSGYAIKRRQTTEALIQEVTANNPDRVEVAFPWPLKELNPNKKLHRMIKAKAFKKYKADCINTALEAKLHLKKHTLVSNGLALRVKYTFNPPDKRRRDKDNCIGSIKALQDAIAHVVAVDDYYFVTTYAMGPNGAGNVTVLIEVAA
jgi:crossover junction endodeoxyribonuclease RusA